MTDKNIIEDLIRGIDKTFDKQLGNLDNLYKKLEQAEQNDSTKEYMALLSKEIGRVERAINSQRDLMSSVYGEVASRAEKRGEKVDFEVVKDLRSFMQSLADRQNMIDKLKEENKSSKTLTRGQKRLNSANIQRLEIEQRRAIESKKTEYKQKYQKGSAALGALSVLTIKKNIKDVAQKTLEIEEGQEVNLRKIYQAEVVNNRELRRTQEIWGVIKDSASETWRQIKTGGNYWLKFNAQAISDAKRLGMTNKEAAMGYMKSLMESSKELARNFGMSTEQAMKMQEAYSKVTGRAAMLNQAQMEDVAAASKLMGEETVQSAIGIMDKMGTTSQSTMEMIDKNFLRASSVGLDAVKTSEAFVKNLDLANRLNFRNGIDGISKMTILSQRMKLNLQEVANVAEKFSTIEGAIEGSARLQVLGGAGALYGSNPMQMLYESLSDPEALYERMTKMFADQATFDRTTGEARISPFQQAIIREQAKAMGMNETEAVSNAKQQAKLVAIESDFQKFAPSAYAAATPEQKEAILNKAEYDAENKTWVVNYIDEEGEKQTVDIRDLKTEQLEAISKDNVEDVKAIREHVRDIARELVGTKERKDSMKDQWYTGISQSIHWAMRSFDSILTRFNKTDFWKFITGAGSVLGVLGLGAASAIRGWGMLKGAKIAGKWGPLLLRKGGFGRLGTAIGKSLSGVKNTFSKGISKITNIFKSAPKGGGVVSDGLPVAGGALGETTATGTLTKGVETTKSVISTGKTLGTLGKVIKYGGPVMAAIGGIIEGVSEWNKADATYNKAKSFTDKANASNNYTIGGRYYGAKEIQAMRTAAENRRSEGRAGAVGAGVGTTAGTLIGGAIGTMIAPGVGTAVGAAIGGYLGGKYGKKVGSSMASTKDDDVINEHLNEINKSDDEENFRKIVLPVESIDYNVSLIANQLGIMSARPARGNIYLQAEAEGVQPLMVEGSMPNRANVEGMPLEASTVNQVDTHIIQSSQISQTSGSLALNVNGSIDLNMGGSNVGKFGPNEIRELFNRPEIQRQLAEIMFKQEARSGNGGRVIDENAYARRSMTSDGLNRMT